MDLFNFYFTCESIRCPENREHMARMARAIIKTYILNNGTIRANLSEQVMDKLVSVYKQLNQSKGTDSGDGSSDQNNNNNGRAKFTSDFYMTLFNGAQEEIHTKLSGALYSNFLRHDIYLRHLS